MENVNKQLLDAAKALESCNWSGVSIGNKAVIAQAVKLLQSQAIAAAEQAQQAEPVAEDPAVAAIQFALETNSDGLHFLRLWNEGEFDLLRREWPEAPEDIYIGADPLLEVSAQPPAVAVAVPGEWREMVEAAIVALKWYADVGHVETLSGKLDWPAEREKLKAKGFRCEGEHQDGTEVFVEYGDMAAAAVGKLGAMLAAAPQAAVAAPLPPYDTFSNDDGDSWQDCPDDAKFVNGRQLGEEFELLAGWHAERVTFRVTKVPDDESDDYEVEEVTAPAAAQKGGV